VVLLVLVAGVWGAYLLFNKQLTMENMARHEATFRQWCRDHPIMIYAAAFAIYVAVAALLPSATALSVAYGWFFGFWRALVLVSFASTCSATLAFLLSRYLLRDIWRRRLSHRVAGVQESFRREGIWYLFAMRLTPVIPYFVVNAVMGLTDMRPRTFWWVSQLGMLPGTAVYLYAGSSAPSLQALAERGLEGVPVVRLLVALCLLGCFPLAARAVVRRVSARKRRGRVKSEEK
jgi:uncharacterized membrane protein YdjX (TVP38/TMEM64 family)